MWPGMASPDGKIQIDLSPETKATLDNFAAAAAPTEALLQFFEYAHLPGHLQAVSKPFCYLAKELMNLPRNPERTVALRKLLEAKDCAVRAALFKD